MPIAAVLHRDGDPRRRPARRAQLDVGRPPRPPGRARPRATASRALVRMLTSAVRRRSRVGDHARPGRGSEPQADAGRALAGHGAAGRRVAADRVEVGRARTRSRIGRAKSSTSSTMRLRRRTSWSMSRSRLRDAPPAAASARRSVRSEALMIMSGLRTSWAMTVDRRPRADSRSRSAGLALEAGDGLGQRVEGAGQQARVLVVPAAGRAAILPREVAGGRPSRAWRR